MNKTVSKSPFEHAGECLRRNRSSGVYFAWVRYRGKLFRDSLETKDKLTAKRLLREYIEKLHKLDVGEGNMTLSELCDRYLATIQNQAPKTVRWKTDAVKSLKRDWKGGVYVPISKIRASELKGWLASYDFGYASYNHHLEVVRAMFLLAVEDRKLMESPAATLKEKRPGKPIRDTPTWEQFQALIADIRAQRFNPDAGESADYVELIGLAGIGNAEANNLVWGDVDWGRGKIKIHRKKTDMGFLIPIYPQLRPLLERLKGGKEPSHNAIILKIKDAKKGITAACKRLNFPTFGHRSMRRMFITRAIEKGIDVKTIASWQGHRDGGKLILSTYSHLAQPHADSMALRLTEA